MANVIPVRLNSLILIQHLRRYIITTFLVLVPGGFVLEGQIHALIQSVEQRQAHQIREFWERHNPLHPDLDYHARNMTAVKKNYLLVSVTGSNYLNNSWQKDLTLKLDFNDQDQITLISFNRDKEASKINYLYPTKTDITAILSVKQKNDFVQIGKVNTKINNKSQVIETNFYRFDKNTWVNTQKIESEYDHHRLISEVSTVYDLNHQKVIHKSNFEYTPQKDRLLVEVHKLHYGNQKCHANDFQLVYSYDSANMAFRLIRNLCVEGKWVPALKILATYDSKRNLIEKTFHTPTTDGQWYNIHRFFYEYNPNGTLAKLTVQIWRNQWVNKYRFEYVYNNNGLISQEIYKQFQQDVWISDYKYDYQYAPMLKNKPIKQDSKPITEHPNLSLKPSRTPQPVELPTNSQTSAPVVINLPKPVTPKQKKIEQAWLYANPFIHETTFTYVITQPGRVTLKIMTSQGKPIVTLINADQTKGRYNVTWKGSDDSGKPLPAGRYLYQLSVADETAVGAIYIHR